MVAPDKGKWGFLNLFVSNIREQNEEITVSEIADIAIKAYNLKLEKEQVRKIVSRILNENSTSEIILTTPADTRDRIAAWSDEKKAIEIVAEEKTTTPSRVRWEKEGQYLVLGCWHVPFHNQRLTDGVLKLIEQLDLQGIVFNGDFLDCNSLSGHDRGRFTAIPNLTLKQEYKEGLSLLKEFDKQLPKDVQKAYMYGNHEDRYWRFVSEMQNAKTPPQSPAEGLELASLGYLALESYADNYLTLGDHLDVIHGIFFSDHCAKKHIDRFRGSCLFAHTHRIQTYIEGNTGGFNIGWGGDKNSPAFRYADRAMKASWQNGFAIVNIDRQGDYYMQQVICNDGRFYYNGKKF